jgi:glycosyltransferase involved in cell wall biosynthesis
MKGLSVLSLGSTRALWDGESADDYQRMMGYAEQLDEYVIVAHSYKRHGLKPRHLGPHVEAIPTDAFCGFDSLVRMLRIGYSVLRARSFSLIQAQDPFYLGLVAILLGKRFRLPVNICLYGPNIYDPHWLANGWSHGLLARLGRWVLSQCHGVQVDGKLTADRLIAAGFPSERVEVKKMVPADLEHFLKIDPASRVLGQAARILYVGRFASQKNLPLLLQAVKQLRARKVGRFELMLVGEGPEERGLRTIIEREGLQNSVNFYGPVGRDKIADVFARADIFALTSDFEGYPRVLMEAAASALPIVTTAVSGSNEAVVDGETGYIVPIGDVHAVVDKLAVLLADREACVRMGRAAREHIRAHLDPGTNTPGQLAIWRKVASNAVPRVHQERREVRVVKDPGQRLRPIRRLLLFNLVTDVKHPILGFTTQWIRELAARVEHIDVITMLAGDIAVPDNVSVHSVGKERGYSEPRRAIEFYRHLFSILCTERIDGCFSHMMPVFSVLAGPVLRAVGIPLVTWYAHPSLTPTLKVAHFFSNRMVASLPNAYPYRRNKLAVIGQGIDTAMFAPSKHPAAQDDVILCVGRLSRVKNHPTLLRAVALLPRRFRVVILGATSGADDEAYASELRRLVDELALCDVVVFEKPVPPAELPSRYLACAVHVNLTPAGFGDKVAWEAMACGRPCLVANEDFRETLGRYADKLLFRVNDPADLAVKLSAVLEKSTAERAEMGAYLRSRVEGLHSLPRLAARILEQIDLVRMGITHAQSVVVKEATRRC